MVPVAMETHLRETRQLDVCRRLLLRQQNAVPRGPLGEVVPSDEDQIVEVLPRTQDALTVPDVLDEVAHVLLLLRGGLQVQRMISKTELGFKEEHIVVLHGQHTQHRSKRQS